MKDGNGMEQQPPPYSQIYQIGGMSATSTSVPGYQNPNTPAVHHVGGIAQHTMATPVYPYPQQQTFISTQPIATAPPMYGATETTVVNIPTEILVIGGCPACRIGVLQDDFSCLGILCAIVFFPVGILCCLALKSKRCSNCGMEY
ncbi:hypothetical protein HA402_009338 [Bradysia odoriphaga]|nr:hypothetical protein HA402_009338 [Bradysia odoriphaga]